MSKREHDPIQASVDKITDIILEHLSTLSPGERKKRIKAFHDHASQILERNSRTRKGRLQTAGYPRLSRVS